MIVNPVILGGAKLPALDHPGAASDLLEGKQLVDQYGNPLTGTMPKKSAGDLTASGGAVTVPAGYYPEQVSKSVAAAAQATPGISVSSNGLITASASQGEGYVAAGTKSATRQLTTQAGKTVTPGTSRQTAVSSGRYTTGAVYVAGDANLVAGNIKSGVSIFGVAGTMSAGLFEILTGGTFTGNGSNVLTFSQNAFDCQKARIITITAQSSTQLMVGSDRYLLSMCAISPYTDGWRTLVFEGVVYYGGAKFATLEKSNTYNSVSLSAGSNGANPTVTIALYTPIKFYSGITYHYSIWGIV